jgi:hypothetical protein
MIIIAAAAGCAARRDQQVQSPWTPSSVERRGNLHLARPSDGNDVGAAERGAYERAKPVFDARCGKCHTHSGSSSDDHALSHFNMDDYPFGGHHADEPAESVRAVLGAKGSRPTMPRDQPGAVQGEELRLILAWADAYDQAHPHRSPQLGGEHVGTELDDDDRESREHSH